MKNTNKLEKIKQQREIVFEDHYYESLVMIHQLSMKLMLLFMAFIDSCYNKTKIVNEIVLTLKSFCLPSNVAALEQVSGAAKICHRPLADSDFPEK